MIVLVDGQGRTVRLPQPAQRVVSIAPSNTEILFAVGAGSQVVGRDEFSDYPPEAAALASVGGGWGPLNMEALVALQPDLVLAADINPPEQIAALEELGLVVFQVPNPTDFEGLFANIGTVGQLVDRQANARALVEKLRERVAAVEAALAGAEPVMVYYEADGTDPNAPWTAGAGTFQDMLIAMAGGENVAADIQGWGQISLEELVARDPVVMIFGAGPWVPTTAVSVAEREGWEAITAVAQGAVYPLDTNWVDRPAPRLVDALEAMARLIHPERFDG
jgi:iron complex transport system substrate-binding protein